MSLTFYYSPMSSAVRVHWALEELGIPYEKVLVNLKAGEQKKPEFLKLNPNGKVPLLVIDGTPLFESSAQLIYLGETYGVEKKLYPAPGRDRIEALKWIAWSSVTLVGSAMRLMHNTAEHIPAEQHNAKAAEVARKELADELRIIDDRLSGREYLLGSAFSMADVAAGGMPWFLSHIGIDCSPYKNVTAWGQRCAARPAHQRVMAG